MRVLVCDDHVDAADVLALILRQHGHEVKVSYDGRSCVREALDWKPAIAFLDIGMPDVTGYDVAHELRARLGATVLLVAVNAFDSPQHKKASLEAGFNIHLSKPTPLDHIVALAAAASRPGSTAA